MAIEFRPEHSTWCFPNMFDHERFYSKSIEWNLDNIIFIKLDIKVRFIVGVTHIMLVKINIVIIYNKK